MDPQLIAAPTDVPNTETIDAPNGLRHTDASSDSVSNLSHSQNDSLEAVRKMADTHMIVATLVATVTFTAGLTVPGVYYGNDGPNPGKAILSRTVAFKVFIWSDITAFILSAIAVMKYLEARTYNGADARLLKKKYRFPCLLVALALVTMMIAFVTGTYAVLTKSLAHAIAHYILLLILVLINYISSRWIVVELYSWYMDAEQTIRNNPQQSMI